MPGENSQKHPETTLFYWS